MNARWMVWRRLGCSPTVVDWLRHGVPVTLLEPPPAARRQTRIDQRILPKLDDMLASGVIERVQEEELRHSAPLFPVPKGQSIRVIHDLRKLNAVTAERRVFRLFGIKRAVQMIKKGDFMLKIDLQSGYHQLGVRPQDRDLLGIILPDGTAFQYRGLGFGWTAAPFHFQSVTVQLAKIIALRFQVRVNVYLDDFLIAHEEQAHLRRSGPLILDLMLALGAIPSIEKSDITPRQRIIFLGVELDSLDLSMRIAEQKAKVYAEELSAALESASIRPDRWMTILGRLSFFATTARDALLHLRALQKLETSALMPFEGQTRSLVSPWITLLRERPKRSFAELRTLWGWDETLQLSASTDASQESWGACLYVGPGGQTAQGSFPGHLSDSSINVKELYALLRGIQLVPRQRHLSKVTLFTDNTAARAWINRQGSTTAPDEAMDILSEISAEARDRNLTIRVDFIPGHMNVTADRLSRFGRLEWHTPRGILEAIQREWGPVHVDATAPPDKTLALPGFCQRHWTISDRGLSRDWRGLRVYLAPPIAMLGTVAARLDPILTTQTTLHPRQTPSCAIVLLPDMKTEAALRLRRMTRTIRYFSITEEQAAGYELQHLTRHGKVRMMALFIHTSSAPSASQTPSSTSPRDAQSRAGSSSL